MPVNLKTPSLPVGEGVFLYRITVLTRAGSAVVIIGLNPARTGTVAAARSMAGLAGGPAGFGILPVKSELSLSAASKSAWSFNVSVMREA